MKIDIKGLDAVVASLKMPPRHGLRLVETSVRAVTLELARQWDRAASRELRSSRAQYRMGIVVADRGPLVGVVGLAGTLNNMIEDGAGAFDMKPSFAASRRKKTGRKGQWYIAVPFRIAGSGAVAESSAFSGTMPPEVAKLVRAGRGAPVKASDLPAGMQKPGMRAAVTNLATRQTFAEYQRKTARFAGLRKFGTGRSGGFVLFRTASELSPANAWVHPGMNARKLAEKAVASTHVETIVSNVIEEFAL